jgi:hypothetical protein
MNTASKYQLFSIITICKCLFLDSNAKKEFGSCRERTSMLEGRRRTKGRRRPTKRWRRMPA